MKIYLENLKIVTLAQILRYVALLFNVVSFFFVLVYSIVHTPGAAADAFAILFLVALAFDLLNATVTKNGFGFWLILFLGVAMFGLYGFSILGGLTPFENSANIGGTVLALLMLLASSALLVSDCLMLPGKGKKPSKFSKILRVALVAAGSAAMIAFAILTYDAVYNYGFSVNEYTTTRAEFLLAFTAFAVLCLLVRLTLTEGSGNLKEKFRKGWAFLLIVVGLGAFTFSNYFIEIDSVAGDVAAADASFERAFGKSALDGTEEMRSVRFSFADSLFGIPTGGFTLHENEIYFSDGGLTLRCDAYVPDAEDAHKSVLVAMHGRSNDKGNSSVPHRNKYFASKGYVVFDLQIGDFREADTGADRSVKPSSADMLPNIDRFFEYLSAHNDYGANLDSVFLTGYSMGATLSAKYGLSYENAAEAAGVRLRGLVPCYPGYYAGDKGMDNFLNYVDGESLPMLMLMGMNDGEVNRDVIYEAEAAYAEANNPNYAYVGVSYSGHGCDFAMGSRANQIFLYYMERFLYLFR